MQIRSNRLFVLFATALFGLNLFTACNNNHASNKKASVSTAEIPHSNNPLDSLEKIFDNDNWMSINRKDTSYYYFSRTEPASMKVINYSMLRGDSVNTVVSAMIGQNNEITWQSMGRRLKLVSTGTTSCTWVDLASNAPIVFTKTDSNNIEVLLTGGSQIMKLQKTITLSSFLTRSRYDFKNNTRLAFEGSNK